MSQEIQKLEDEYFMLQMKDNWDSDDFRYADEIREKIRRLKNA